MSKHTRTEEQKANDIRLARAFLGWPSEDAGFTGELDGAFSYHVCPFISINGGDAARLAMVLGMSLFAASDHWRAVIPGEATVTAPTFSEAVSKAALALLDKEAARA